MRWLWIDRFVEFERGRRAVAIKNIALTEPQLDGYLPGSPLMPAPLIIEGLAQTAGLLAGEISGFRSRVVLAKITKAVFHFNAYPGDTLMYTAVLENVEPSGAIAIATSRLGDRVQADVEFMFAFLTGDKFANQELFDPADLLRMVRTFCLYEVGKDEHGQPLTVPDYMAEAEQRSIASYTNPAAGS
jgi:3-hydroxyacyl-[acyl-carrier-protein] dehydratase